MRLCLCKIQISVFFNGPLHSFLTAGFCSPSKAPNLLRVTQALLPLASVACSTSEGPFVLSTIFSRRFLALPDTPGSLLLFQSLVGCFPAPVLCRPARARGHPNPSLLPASYTHTLGIANTSFWPQVSSPGWRRESSQSVTGL